MQCSLIDDPPSWRVVGVVRSFTMTMTDEEIATLEAGRCPICDRRFEDETSEDRCDHEAGFYREWIAHLIARAAHRIDRVRQLYVSSLAPAAKTGDVMRVLAMGSWYIGDADDIALDHVPGQLVIAIGEQAHLDFATALSTRALRHALELRDMLVIDKPANTLRPVDQSPLRPVGLGPMPAEDIYALAGFGNVEAADVEFLVRLAEKRLGVE